LAAIGELAKSAHVIAPTHPGFGRSELPKGMRWVDDLSYFYLDLLEQLDLRDVVVVGVGFGAWIAAEIAVKSCERIGRLVLADAPATPVEVIRPRLAGDQLIGPLERPSPFPRPADALMRRITAGNRPIGQARRLHVLNLP